VSKDSLLWQSLISIAPTETEVPCDFGAKRIELPPPEPHRYGARQPAALASASLQNQRSPFEVSILVAA
jgi:hypothetical protein